VPAAFVSLNWVGSVISSAKMPWPPEASPLTSTVRHSVPMKASLTCGEPST
jgi:hypothetical protein